VYQRIDKVANRSEETHVPCTSGVADALPFMIGQSCQTPLKRTLKAPAGRAAGGLAGSSRLHAPAHLAAMVNHRFPRGVSAGRLFAAFSSAESAFAPRQQRGRSALSQILPKLRSFKFSEKLSRIHIEFGQNPLHATNRTFKPAC
jgi:hypothetical protein